MTSNKEKAEQAFNELPAAIRSPVNKQLFIHAFMIGYMKRQDEELDALTEVLNTKLGGTNEPER